METVARKVQVIIHRPALESIFAECDRYDHDETGGRLLGTYRKGLLGGLKITVSGVIEPGPSARRTATSFFQDGSYQENVFRTLEKTYPDIEHLGNWHTHHVNGYPTLSGGDRDTYHRIVNHQNHNTDFFYALLVTARNGRAGSPGPYTFRNFILFRNDPNEYEIPSSLVRVVDEPAIWPRTMSPNQQQVSEAPAPSSSASSEQRAIDGQFIKDLYPGLRAFLSKNTGKVYWRGRIDLADDSSAEVVVAELEDGDYVAYGVGVKEEPYASSSAIQAMAQRRFSSAREALVRVERELNREVFHFRVGNKSRHHSIKGDA